MPADRLLRTVRLKRATPYSQTAAPMLVPAMKTMASVEVTASLNSAVPNAPA